MNKLSGLVAAIINERELVINIGANVGVQRGMIFSVKDEETPINDPKTNEVLGSIRREKIKVKAEDVQNRYTVARTFETYEVNLGGRGEVISSMRDVFSAPRWVTRVKTLKARDQNSMLFDPLDETKSLINVGDIVEQLEGNTETTDSGIPRLLVGRWEHYWDKTNKADVTINEDGLYIAKMPNDEKRFKLTNAAYSVEKKEVRFDLIKADGTKDTTQILQVERPNLLNGIVEGKPGNPRRYERLP